MKQLMLGNAAVARGAYEAGCHFVASYPGTPSTEITKHTSEYSEIRTHWSPNEATALESAMGASLAGARAMAGMNSVGLNVASDALCAASYTGVNGGLVVVVGDDPGMRVSESNQDSRRFAVAAKLPTLEPSDAVDCLEFTKLAFELSEEFDTPVLLRITTGVARSSSELELGERVERDLIPYRKKTEKYVMLPENARKRRDVVAERSERLGAFAETTKINRAEYRDEALGFVTSGACYEYVRSAYPDASVLKLGMVNPMPKNLLLEFSQRVDRLVVVEESDPIILEHCLALGIEVSQGEDIRPQSDAPLIPARQVFCAGCPHRGVFYVLNKLWLRVIGDLGCYTLGALAPSLSTDAAWCMGASISALGGLHTMLGEKSLRDTVAVIGDSSFCHSGMAGLLDLVNNVGAGTVLILDNGCAAVSGRQPTPLKAPASLENICEGLGVGRISVVDPFELDLLERAVREELAVNEVSVIICRRDCALLGKVPADVVRYEVYSDRCRGCRSCQKLGCPAIELHGKRALIDSKKCVGCGLCLQICKCDAIRPLRNGIN